MNKKKLIQHSLIHGHILYSKDICIYSRGGQNTLMFWSDTSIINIDGFWSMYREKNRFLSRCPMFFQKRIYLNLNRENIII